MKCPTCGETTPELFWTVMSTAAGITARGGEYGTIYHLQAPQEPGDLVQLHWMRCANERCKELVIRLREGYLVARDGDEDFEATDTWIVRPRSSGRHADPAVPQKLRDDYLEAADILDRSPRMAAVLARSILADVLEVYGKLTQWGLTARIDAFVKDDSRPHDLRLNAHYVRVMGDFSAHSIRPKVDDEITGVSGMPDTDAETVDVEHARRIEINPAEAAWTLGVVDAFFDYFIVGPARGRGMRESIGEKISDAGRDPIEPPPSPEK